MTLTLYTCTAENNRLNKSAFLTSLGSVAGTMLEGSSVDNPGIKIYYNGTPAAANYFYISNFARYYHRTDLIYIGGNCWEIHGKSDPLMSFRTGISGCTAWVNRNENTYNGKLADNVTPSSASPVTMQYNAADSSSWISSSEMSNNPAGNHFILTMDCGIKSPGGNYYSTGYGCTALTGPASLIHDCMNSIAKTAVFDPTQHYRRLYAVPVSVPSFSVGGDAIVIGTILTIPETADLPSGALAVTSGASVSVTWNITITNAVTDTHYSEWLPPKCTYTLSFLPFGTFTLDPGILFPGTSFDSVTVAITTETNPLTGDSILSYKVGQVTRVLAAANVARDFAFSAPPPVAASLIPSALSIIDTANTQVGAGVLKVAERLSMPSTAVGTVGSGYIAKKPVIHKTYYPTPERGAETLGFPLEKEVVLSTLSGFTVAQSVQLDGVAATATEKDEIERAFREGVTL